MADPYICSGAIIRCSCGSGTSVFKVLPDRKVMLAGNPPMANISDIKTGTNIFPFGLCATTIIPTPCTPAVTAPWQNGKMDYLIRNNPALLKSSTCICKRGGIITFVDDGQKGENSGIKKQPKEDFKVLEKDKIVIVNAYWTFFYRRDKNQKTFGHTYKMKFIPYQKVESLVVEFYYQYDDEFHSKNNLKLILKNPDGVGNATKTILINKPVQIGDYKKNGIQRKLYKHYVTDFTSDMKYIK